MILPALLRGITMKLRIVVALMMAALLLGACSGGDDDAASEVGDAEQGETLFRQGKGTEVPPCITCHRVTEGGSGFALGPNLTEIATTAATRVDGVEAEDYIRKSITDPESFVVPGFSVQMYTGYGESLSDGEIADLVAFLLSL